MDDLERVTVALVPEASAAVRATSAIEADTMTDTINRAIQAYAWIVEQELLGNTIKVVQPDGTTHTVTFTRD